MSRDRGSGYITGTHILTSNSSIPAYDGGLALPGNFSQRLVENAEGLDMSLDFACLRGGFPVCSSHQLPGLDDSEANPTILRMHSLLPAHHLQFPGIGRAELRHRQGDSVS